MYHLNIDTLKRMVELGIDMRFYVYEILTRKINSSDVIKYLKSLNYEEIIITTFGDLITSDFNVNQMELILESNTRYSTKNMTRDLTKKQARHLVSMGFTTNPYLPEIFVEVFLENGVDPNIYTNYIAHYSLKTVILLIKYGIDVNHLYGNQKINELAIAARQYYELFN